MTSNNPRNIDHDKLLVIEQAVKFMAEKLDSHVLEDKEQFQKLNDASDKINKKLDEIDRWRLKKEGVYIAAVALAAMLGSALLPTLVSNVMK